MASHYPLEQGSFMTWLLLACPYLHISFSLILDKFALLQQAMFPLLPPVLAYVSILTGTPVRSLPACLLRGTLLGALPNTIPRDFRVPFYLPLLYLVYRLWGSQTSLFCGPLTPPWCMHLQKSSEVLLTFLHTYIFELRYKCLIFWNELINKMKNKSNDQVAPRTIDITSRVKICFKSAWESLWSWIWDIGIGRIKRVGGLSVIRGTQESQGNPKMERLRKLAWRDLQASVM